MVAIGNLGQPTCRAEFRETSESQQSTFVTKNNDQNKLALDANVLHARNCHIMM